MDEHKKNHPDDHLHNEAPVDTRSELTPKSSAPVSDKAKSMKFNQMGVIAVVLVALLAGGALTWTLLNQSTKNDVIDFSTTASFDLASLPEVVAIINGVEVSKLEFEQSYEQSVQIAVQQGFDATDSDIQTQIKAQSIEVLVNTKLLTLAAKGAGFTATPDQIAAEITTLEAQFGGVEEFAAELDNASITRAELEEDITSQLIIDAFIQSSPEWSEEFVVSEAEARAFYDEVAARGGEIPAYDEVFDQIKAELLAQKQQTATQTLIERLRTEGEIEVLI